MRRYLPDSDANLLQAVMNKKHLSWGISWSPAFQQIKHAKTTRKSSRRKILRAHRRRSLHFRYDWVPLCGLSEMVLPHDEQDPKPTKKGWCILSTSVVHRRISSTASLQHATSSHAPACVLAAVTATNSRGTRHKLGERSFSFAGPAAWNSLPPSLHELTNTVIFKKKHLKTHLFTRAFGP